MEKQNQQMKENDESEHTAAQEPEAPLVQEKTESEADGGHDEDHEADKNKKQQEGVTEEGAAELPSEQGQQAAGGSADECSQDAGGQSRGLPAKRAASDLQSAEVHPEPWDAWSKRACQTIQVVLWVQPLFAVVFVSVLRRVRANSLPSDTL